MGACLKLNLRSKWIIRLVTNGCNNPYTVQSNRRAVQTPVTQIVISEGSTTAYGCNLHFQFNSILFIKCFSQLLSSQSSFAESSSDPRESHPETKELSIQEKEMNENSLCHKLLDNSTRSSHYCNSNLQSD